MFIDAPGGNGKSFLVNKILTKLLSEDLIIFSTATTGIASTLLEKG